MCKYCDGLESLEEFDGDYGELNNLTFCFQLFITNKAVRIEVF